MITETKCLPRGGNDQKRAPESHSKPPLSPVQTPLTGAFGFVVLAEEIGTTEKWAIKFLERGNKITKVKDSRIENGGFSVVSFCSVSLQLLLLASCYFFPNEKPKDINI